MWVGSEPAAATYFAVFRPRVLLQGSLLKEMKEKAILYYSLTVDWALEQ